MGNGAFLAGESVVNMGGVGADMGMKPSFPWRECEPWGWTPFVGEGLWGPEGG